MLTYILNQPCKPLIILFAILFISCGSDNSGAIERLNKARQLSDAGDYVMAKQEIDSLKALYPKAFDQIRASLALLDTIRRGENVKQIAVCDSLIKLHEPQVELLKKMFVFQQDKRYQETGAYVPKETGTDALTATTLRSGVGEDGQLYIESIFVGGSQKHNRVRISTKDGSFAESLLVNDDGLNFRFSNLGKNYEVIKIAGTSDNGVARFIVANAAKPLTLTLEGQGKHSYTLPQPVKAAVAKSYELSTMMLQLDSLKTEKEKAEFKNYYLDNKNNKVADADQNIE